MESQENAESSPIELSTTATKDTPSKAKAKKKDQGPLIAFTLCFPALIFAVATVIMTIMGFLGGGGSFGWMCEICASLREQYVLILLFCMLPALFSPPWRLPLLGVCALFLMINLACVVPSMFGGTTVNDANLKFLKFKVMEVNLDDPDMDPKPIVDEIAKNRPEVVCITGLNIQTLNKFNEQMLEYMHRFVYAPQDGSGLGMAIYSTVPLKGNRLLKVGPKKELVMLSTIQFDYGWFRLVVIKLPAPKDGDGLDKRNEQADAVSKMIASLNGRKIVVGNFNMTPYSVAYGNLMKTANLKDSRSGFGVQPNWHYPEKTDLYFLRFPVDYILINEDVAAMSRFVAAPCGLTHRPLVGEFCPANSNQPPFEPAKETSKDDFVPGAAKPAPPAAAAATSKPGKEPPAKKGGGKRKKRG